MMIRLLRGDRDARATLMPHMPTAHDAFGVCRHDFLLLVLPFADRWLLMPVLPLRLCRLLRYVNALFTR